MAREGRIRLQDAVGSRVVPSRVHGIRACLVQRRGKPDVSGGPAGDGDFGHGRYEQRGKSEQRKKDWPGNIERRQGRLLK